MTAERFAHALMVGKFCPPHIGHLHVIEEAAHRSDRVSVVVAANSDELLGLGERVEWLSSAAAAWPNVSVVGVMDDYAIDYSDPAVWDAHGAVFREAVSEVAHVVAVDSVFTGEDYGDELARRFQAAHIRFYREPDCVSGRRLRGNLARHWTDLIEPARVALAAAWSWSAPSRPAPRHSHMT